MAHLTGPRGRGRGETYPERRAEGSSTSGGTVQATKSGTNVAGTGAGSDKWTIITGNDFVYSGSPDFTFAPASCVFTYVGASGRTFLFALYVSMDASNAGIFPNSMAAVLSRNGEFDGVSPAHSDAAAVAGASYGNLSVSQASDNVSGVRRITLNNGDTIKPVIAIFGTAQDLLITALSISWIPQ